MSITKSVFGKAPCGKDVDLYIMKNSKGTELHVLTYGLRIQKLLVADKNGELGDVVLGYDNIEEYLGADYQGSFVGRYANRIGKAEFSIDGTKYTLNKNDGNNSLHGGPCGYHQIVWDIQAINDGDEPSITFTHISPDGDEGFPGTLKMSITYTLTASNEVVLKYEGTSDKKTPFNPTNHSFFNLSGDHSQKVLDTNITINSKTATVIDDELIPTGEIVSITCTGLDFSNGKDLGMDMFSSEETIAKNNGFDHNFCVEGSGMRLHATASHKQSGRTMQVYSDMPGIQLYTFNSANGKTGKNGVVMGDHTAFCLETQFYPDSVNQPSFPFKYLEPGVPFSTTTVFKFV